MVGSVAFAITMLGGGSMTAYAADQPDQLITGKKLLIKTNSGDTTKNKVVFLSKGGGFILPDSSNDPTAGAGAVLRILDTGTTGGSAAISLPAADWKAVSGGFKYKGAPGAPCTTAQIKDNKLVKVVCKGASITVTPPFDGDAALALEVGPATIRYCATFGGSALIKNVLKGTKGLVKGKGAPAPTACLACGNGALDPGEQCDDGNTVGGDCCSPTCTFEPSGSPCSDGQACTTGDICDGSGTCGGSSTCGNNVVDAGCGEQCDGSDDGACPGTCLLDCTCLGAPACEGDPSRTVFVGPQDACETLTTEAACDGAFVLNNVGVTSCHWQGAGCYDCTPSLQQDGDCVNACHPPVCHGDPSRTRYTGGPYSSACHAYDGDQTACEQAFHLGQGGIASCWYDGGSNQCRGCGPTNQENGDCMNTCATCGADPSRTIFAGGPNTQACRQFDGDQTSCEQAFHRSECGTSASCWYDGNTTLCRGCGPNNEEDGKCQNTCVAGPLTCTHDPSRTTFAGGPGTGACHTYDGDPGGCAQAFHRDTCNNPTSCYYDFSADECRGCGPNNLDNGSCINTCKSGPVACANDPSRTILAGLPGTSACQQLDAATCAQAFHIGAGGVASCTYDANSSSCMGCGPSNESNGTCVNTCKSGPVACAADPTRTIFAGGPYTSACRQFDGDQPSCEQAFHLGQCGVSSCYYDSGICRGCGPSNAATGECTNSCAPPSCPGDPARTIFAGGPQTSACHQFDGDQTSCEQAYHVGQNGVASCWYDGSSDECRGCGPNNSQNGDCVNTCPVCPQDASRTIFAGGPNTQACRQYDGNKAACEQAFHFNACLQSTSCYYDDNSDSCRGCGPNNQQNGRCIETCGGGLTVACAMDPSRTVFAGGEGTAACHKYDGDPATCAQAFLRGGSGVASCYYDYEEDECRGCGYTNENNHACVNTCVRGVPSCDNDPSRTRFLGGPNTGACHIFDGNQAACEQSFHFDQCFAATSCWYDANSDECRGCGPNNQQDGVCANTCRSGPPLCPGDSSRSNFLGGPSTAACHQFDGDALGCLTAFHRGQCGITSCYFDGSSCRGCGPNNLLNGQCFETCGAP